MLRPLPELYVLNKTLEEAKSVVDDRVSRSFDQPSGFNKVILQCGEKHGWCCFRYKPNMHAILQ